MKSTPFVGRQRELAILNNLFKKKAASLVVISGRRRIGKSRLIEEFAQPYTFYEFAGTPPTTETTCQSQMNEFAKQLNMQTNFPEISVDDWGKLFFILSGIIKEGKIVVLFDEITWMGSKDPDFLGKLKHAWDIYFKKNPQLILVLCGSVSSWIDKNIISSTGFLGRISHHISLEELSLPECNQFLEKTGGIISPYEKLKILTVTGGIPKYLEEIRQDISAEENIRNLCLIKGGPLTKEFDHIFSDLFSTRSPTYKKIVETLAEQSLDIQQICQKLKISPSGFISECLNDLIVSGFLSRDFTWNIQSGEMSNLSHFRLSDNYLRFYLKYIQKYHHQIAMDEFSSKSISTIPNWNSLMGLQFENLVLKNRGIIKNILSILPNDVISDNPFFQKKTTRAAGCQIDYLIQTRFNTLYVCEIKFSKNEISIDIINEVQKKLSAIALPKGFSCRPVLIHVNGVSEEVEDSQYFSHIINFGQFLNSPGSHAI